MQIAALGFVIVCIAFLFWRQENNSAADQRETQRTNVAICDGGNLLAEGQRANINQLADIAQQFARNPAEHEQVEQFRLDQLANVPVFDCDELPSP